MSFNPLSLRLSQQWCSLSTVCLRPTTSPTCESPIRLLRDEDTNATKDAQHRMKVAAHIKMFSFIVYVQNIASFKAK